MVRYQVTKERLYHADIGNYTAYGITAVSVRGGRRTELAHIPDVSLSFEAISELVRRCNKYKLDPIHLTDVVEDFIT